MNIAMMTNNYKPFVGGVPISIERLAAGLEELGHNVHIFAPKYGDMAEADPHIIRYKSFSAKMGIFLIPNSFDRTIIREFKRLKIDLIHTHHPMFIGNTAWYLSRRFNLPLVFTWHTQYEQYMHYLKMWERLEKHALRHPRTTGRIVNRFLHFFSQRVVFNYVKRFANRCNYVVVPSKSVQEMLYSKKISAPMQVMPTGIPLEFFGLDPQKNRALREKYAPGKKYLFCTVSRISREKNIEFLLKCLVFIKRKLGDSFHCLMIGEGPLRKVMEEFVAQNGLLENVTFIGNIPNNHLNVFYSASDLFLFTSKTETQGIVLLEAMAGRTPVVAVNANGVRDVLIDGHNGFMTDENEELYAQAVEKLLSGQNLYEKFSANAYATALNYTTANIAQKAEQVYMLALGSRKKDQDYDAEAVNPVYNISKTD